MPVEHVTPAGANIFADLGFPPDEAENLRVRSRLMMALGDIVRQRRLKQSEAAALFGVSQPRISELMRGRINEFTIDSLVNMLAYAGLRVNLSLSPVQSEAVEAAAPAHAASS
jgi:predicted XRE-type DNA-binding protein